VRKNGAKCFHELIEMQIPLLAVTALSGQSSVGVRTAATDLILAIFVGPFEGTFSLYPYPAVPPESSIGLAFREHIEKFVELSKSEPQFMNCLALLASSGHFQIGALGNLPPSAPLFRLARSAFVFWGERFAERQAIDAISSEDLDLAKEAAALLRLLKPTLPSALFESLHPLVVAICLSRIDSGHEKVASFVPRVAALCPDAFALEFLANFRDFLSPEIAEKAISNAPFSSAFVALSAFLGKPVDRPTLPSTVEECWKARGVICGAVDYVLQTGDYAVLPRLLPCLHSFTNPAADIVCEAILEIEPISERPLDPSAIFERLATVPRSDVPGFLRFAHFFPLRFAMPVFARDDLEALSPVICDFLDDFEDPLPPDSLRPADLSGFFEHFLFSSFFVPACQKLCYFCIAEGADPELRQSFWTNCARYLSRFVIPNVRTDAADFAEEDREVLASILQALRESRPVQTDILAIAVQRIRRYIEVHKGEHAGQVFFEHARRLPEVWAKAILGDNT
jgi:hypothetical protein